MTTTEIFTKNKKLAAIREEAVGKKQLGVNMAKKLTIRVAALRAAESLAAFWPPNSGPERCHELKGNKKGTFSIDLNQPFRLLFRLVEDEPNLNGQTEHERWASVTKLQLIGIEDTHG